MVASDPALCCLDYFPEMKSGQGLGDFRDIRVCVYDSSLNLFIFVPQLKEIPVCLFTNQRQNRVGFYKCKELRGCVCIQAKQS